jgi:cysteine desulfurase/selenocysteine lyase
MATLSELDVRRLRAQTPGCAAVLHLNNAGASLPTQRTLAAVVEHLQLEARIGGYEAAAEAAERIDAFYPAAAALIGAQPDEIAYVENATRAWDMVFYSLASDFRAGDRILTCRSEYSSNYISFLQVARRTGVEIVAVPDDTHGQIDLDALARLVDDRVKLIAISHVPTQGGLVQPAAAIGRIARAAGIPYLLDACQSVGQMPVSVDDIECDFLSATGRKYLRGPRGTGFLYARRSAYQGLEPIFLDNHAASWTGADTYELCEDARRFENWEKPYAQILGLASAIEQTRELGMEAIWQRIHALGETLRARLASVPGVTVRDLGALRCGIVTFSVEGADHVAVRNRLRSRAINVSVSTIFTARLDFGDRGLKDVLRASVHVYNTENELDRFVAALQEVALGH